MIPQRALYFFTYRQENKRRNLSLRITLTFYGRRTIDPSSTTLPMSAVGHLLFLLHFPSYLPLSLFFFVLAWKCLAMADIGFRTMDTHFHNYLHASRLQHSHFTGIKNHTKIMLSFLCSTNDKVSFFLLSLLLESLLSMWVKSTLMESWWKTDWSVQHRKRKCNVRVGWGTVIWHSVNEWWCAYIQVVFFFCLYRCRLAHEDM